MKIKLLTFFTLISMPFLLTSCSNNNRLVSNNPVEATREFTLSLGVVVVENLDEMETETNPWLISMPFNIQVGDTLSFDEIAYEFNCRTNRNDSLEVTLNYFYLWNLDLNDLDDFEDDDLFEVELIRMEENQYLDLVSIFEAKGARIVIGIPVYAVLMGATAVTTMVEVDRYESLTYKIVNQEVIITGYTGSRTDLTIPAERSGLPVRKIADNAFYNSNLTSVSIPNTVTLIGERAFKNSTYLIILSFGWPSQLITIGNEAFTNTAINSVNIPSTVTSIGDYAFYNNDNLAQVDLDSFGDLTTIGRSAFSRTGITHLTIPNSVVFIADHAFSHNINLEFLDFGWGGDLTTIGNHAFSHTGIRSLSIPPSVIYIGDYAFANSEYMTNLSFSSANNLTYIGIGAFSFTGITNTVSLPPSLTTIGERAFANSNIRTLNIPRSAIAALSIGDYAFANNNISGNLNIPSSVAFIGNRAFYNNTLNNITVEANNQTHGDWHPEWNFGFNRQ